LSGELAVIVLGVFLALVADAWREAQVDSRRETEYLRSLASEVERSISSIDDVIRDDSAYAARSVTMYRLLSTTDPPEDSGWRSSLGLAAGGATLATATVRTLMSTGDIRLIRSDSLRVAIVDLAGSLEAHLTWVAQFDQMNNDVLQRQIVELEAIAAMAGWPDTIPIASYRGRPSLTAAYRIHVAALRTKVGLWRELRPAFERVRDLIPADRLDR
jgi:hypothetical protein